MSILTTEEQLAIRNFQVEINALNSKAQQKGQELLAYISKLTTLYGYSVKSHAFDLDTLSFTLIVSQGMPDFCGEKTSASAIRH